VPRYLKVDSAQFGVKVGRHMISFGKNPAKAEDRAWLLQYILDIYTNATEVRDGTFSGQGVTTPLGNLRGPVWFYAKGKDVVIVDKSDNFVTILKDGTSDSTSFKQARILIARP
jgi:hypothetical protein